MVGCDMNEYLLLDELWEEFIQLKRKAHQAVYDGKKLEAIYWAIQAHKTKQEYLYQLQEIYL